MTDRTEGEAYLFEQIRTEKEREKGVEEDRWALLPWLRWTLPWLCGLLAGFALPSFAPWIGALVGGLLVGFLFFFLPFRGGYKDPRFGLVLFPLLFVAGLTVCQYHRQRLHPDRPVGEALYVATVAEPPRVKARSIQMPVRAQEPSGRLSRLLLYFPKDSGAHTLQMGQRLSFYASVSLPADSLAEGEFDYATYLRSHNYSGTAYIRNGAWRTLSSRAPLTLCQKALQLREKLLSTYWSLGFRGESLALLSALTLGDKSGLPTETKELFSVTGVGHVLALSGLHVGILYSVCLFLLSFLPGDHRIGRLLKALLPVVVLWGFAFVTGLSVSVVRSVWMFTFLALFHLARRRHSSLNALAFAAFVTTAANAYVLFDLGFQLSYTAVASILLLHPFLHRLWEPSNRLLRYGWSMASLSLVTQCAVAPLLLRAFGSFSVYFLLGNFWALPITFLLVVGALAMLLCGCFPPLQILLAHGLQSLLRLYVAGLEGLAQWPHAALPLHHPSLLTVVLFYATLLMLLAYLSRPRYRRLVGTFLLAIAFLSSHCYTLLTPSPAYLLVRSSDRGVTLLSAEVGERPMMLTPDEPTGIATFRQRRLLVVRNRRWNHFTAPRRLPLDYLILTGSYTGTLADLQRLFTFRQVVLVATPGDSRSDQWQMECRTRQIPCKVLQANQSWKIDLTQ